MPAPEQSRAYQSRPYTSGMDALMGPHPLFTLLTQSGPFNPTGLQVDERYYFAFFYDNHAGNEWKIDISFWPGEGAHPEPMQDELERELTPETRLAILWIKNIWYRFPAYRSVIYSTDIYNAVLHHGVRTPAQFDQYLANHGKSTHSAVP